MNTAVGRFATTLIGFESTYGTPVASGSYIKVPFVSNDLGSSQPLETSDILTGRRDASTPDYGDIDVAGNIVVPVDRSTFGHWLKALLGAPTTTSTAGSAPYTHVFTSGGSSLPSLTVERGHPERSRYLQQPGARVNSMELTFARGNSMNATLGLIAQGENVLNASAAGTPTDETGAVTRFSGYQAAIKQGGSQLAAVVSGTLNYNNGLEPIRTMRNDRKIDGIDLGTAAASGQLVTRWADNTLLDLAAAGTAITLEFSLTIDANTFLTFYMGEVYLSRPGLPVSGPGGIQITYDWQAAYKASDGEMMTVTLKNTKSSYA